MSRLVPIAALILAGALGIARADVYRWIDEQGVPHYSDQWVPGSVVIKTLKPHPAGAEGGAGGGDRKSLAAASGRASSELSEQANARATQQDVAKVREAQCKMAKDNYMRSLQSRRIYNETKSGERDYLSDEAADAYRAKMRKDVQDKCGSVPEFKPDQPIPEPQPIEPKPIPEPKVNPAGATSS
jgi:hypothetical protein